MIGFGVSACFSFYFAYKAKSEWSKKVPVPESIVPSKKLMSKESVVPKQITGYVPGNYKGTIRRRLYVSRTFEERTLQDDTEQYVHKTEILLILAIVITAFTYLLSRRRSSK